MWTESVAPAEWHYHTIITQHKTICCYVIPLTPYTRVETARERRHAASGCDCSKLSGAWNSVQCVEGARPARGAFAANFTRVGRIRSSPDGRWSYISRHALLFITPENNGPVVAFTKTRTLILLPFDHPASTSNVAVTQSHKGTCSKFGHGQDRNIIS